MRRFVPQFCLLLLLGPLFFCAAQTYEVGIQKNLALPDGPAEEEAPRQAVALPPIQPPRARPEPDSWKFYYTNSYEGEYPGNLEDLEPLPPPESDPPPGDIVPLPPETGRVRVAEAGEPLPPSPPQSLPAPPQSRPSQPAQARPVSPPPAPPAQTLPIPPPPPVQTPPSSPPPGRPPSAPQPEKSAAGTASASVALPADTDRVVLSMDRDESGKLWVYIESETAREIAVTEVPRPEPIQAPTRTPDPPPAQAQTQPPPPVQVQAPPAPQTPPPPPPTPPPERRRVTVTIIPRLPPAGDGKRYTLQVGSYRERVIAESLLFTLQNAGIPAVLEVQGANIRVIISGTLAEDIPVLAEKLGKAGVTEIWVRDR